MTDTIPISLRRGDRELMEKNNISPSELFREALDGYSKSTPDTTSDEELLKNPEFLQLMDFYKKILKRQADNWKHPEENRSRSETWLRCRCEELQKFGLVSKGADYSRTRIHKLIETLKDTIICKEAVNRILWERMDLEKTKYIVNEVQTGKIKVQITGLTKIGLAGYAKRNFIIAPERAEREILLKLKSRLENERVALVCLGCKRAHTMVIKNITSLKCPVCSSVLVAFAEKPEIIEKLRKNKLSDKEIRRLRKSANLILYNGRKALTALAARGVGIDTAARILANGCFTEEDFLREILRAEITYARTKKFW